MLRLLQRLPKAISPRFAGADTEVIPLALLEFQSPTSAIVATPVPLFVRYTGFWVSLLVFSLLFVASVMQIDTEVVTTGDLVTSAPTTVIQPFVTSIVKSINVHPGEFVHRGDVLATLDPTFASADLTEMTSQQQAYSAQVSQLQAQEDNKPYLPDASNPASTLQMQTYSQQIAQYNATVDDYNEKIAALQTAVIGYNEQAAYYREQIKIATDVNTMREQLQNMQVGSRLDTLAANATLVSMEASMASAASSAIQNQQDLESQKAELSTFIQQWKANVSTQLSTAINNLTQTQDSLTKAKLNDQLVQLKAQQDSIVLTVAPVSVGAVAQSGATLMQVVPADSPLSIVAEVDGTLDSGYIRPGDEVVIKFETYNFTEHGNARGIVQSVSPSSFDPSPSVPGASAAPLPGGPETLYYNVNISLEELNLHNMRDGMYIVPGMPVEADVVVGHHTVMQYFTRRVLPVAYDSMHEPSTE